MQTDNINNKDVLPDHFFVEEIECNEPDTIIHGISS